MTHKGASPTPAVLPGDTGKDIHGTNAYQKVPDYALEISGKVFKQISILNNIWNEFFAGFCADFSAFWAVPKAIRVWENILKHCRQILDNIPASIKNTSSMISWPIIFVADVLPFWAVPDAIRRWENILKDCRCILDNVPASIVAKYTSGSVFMIFVADVLPFWAMPDAIRRWENILKHCRRILDNFPASLSANYISGSNFTISWPIIFAANVLPFCAVLKAIRRWENVLEYCRRILDNFHQAYLQITFPATISLFFGQLFFAADLLPFWVVPKAIPVWGNFRNHCWCILDDFPANISVKYISGNNFTVYSAVVFVANV